MIKLLVVDDNVGFCTRVCEYLASLPDFDIVGVASDGEDGVIQARKLQPDVVLMDVRMRGFSGLDATEMLKSEMEDVKIIILSQFDLQAYRDAAYSMGAKGYVVKKNMFEELIPTIYKVMSDQAFIDGAPAVCH